MQKIALSPEFDGSLPIHEHLEEIQSLIKKNQTLILCGETGSGKTTQIPKICLNLGFGQTKMIGCTQPRRLAARSVAQRLAFELKTEIGAGVGTKIRFQDRVNPKQTSVKVMTDGILLAEIHHDPLLKAYDVIIIDEAHERSLNIDFLLGYLKNLLPKRQDLKLIITSATIETDKFSIFFNGAPIIEVSGRSYPVDIRYRPPLVNEEEDEENEEQDTKSHLLHVIDDLIKETYQGDILVFLPGERDIREALDSLRRQQPPHTEIVPLYARLSQEEQDKIFKTTGQRRIVLSTNVAETSLTVPGIRYVVDSGLVRVKRFSQRNKIDQLLIEKNSQASAQQRAGRSGRVAPGICVRLYSEEDFVNRPAFTTPELLRSSLAGVILKMAYLELGEIEHFPFIDPPSSKAIQSGRIELLELGAIDEQYQLTALGKQIAKIPIDPHLARILIAAQDYQSITEALIITSFLSIQDPRERPFERRQQADQQHKLFTDPQSDFFTIINLWHAYLKEQGKSKKQQIRWCHDHFLNYKRMREWHDLHHQIKQTAQGFHLIPNDKEATYEQLHRALLSGFISQIGHFHTELDHYQGVRGLKFKISKSSGLASKKPKWIMAAEIIDTGLLQARSIGQIQSHWIEVYAKQLMQYSLTPGEWDPQQGQAIAYENGSLYGLQIINRRKVSLSQRDPEQAHTLLLRHLCVLLELDKNIPDFIRINHETIENVALIEHKTRRQDVLIDEEAIVNLYRNYIPATITKAQELQSWYQQLSPQEKHQLLFTPDQLRKQNSISTTIILYPDTLTINNHLYNLTYRFEPGHPLDGVTITVPLPLLVTLQESYLEWLVPGLIRDKIQQLIKGLPQQIRRHLVPVPTFITEFLNHYSEKNGSLKKSLEEFIAQRYQQKIHPDNWPNTISNHLLMNIRVVDDRLQEIAQSRSLSELKDILKQRLDKEKQQLSHPLLQLTNITQWNFGAIPEYLDITKQGITVRIFPALVNEDNHLFIRAIENPIEAKKITQQGIVKLFEIQFKTWLNNFDKNFSSSKEMGLLLSKSAQPPVSQIELWLKKAWLRLLLKHCLDTFNSNIRDEVTYNQFYLFTKSNLATYLNQLNNVHRKIIELAKRYYLSIEKFKKPSVNDSLTDIVTHFQSLLNWSIWTNLTFNELILLPRYLEGLIIRLERYVLDSRQDLEKCKQTLPFKNRLHDHMSKYGESEHTKQFAKMLEEFYISLYAQPMKTAFPISVQRLKKHWTEYLK